MKKVTATMTIVEILKIQPKADRILNEYGLGCAQCELGAVETLEEGARGHGLAYDEIGELVTRINHLK